MPDSILFDRLPPVGGAMPHLHPNALLRVMDGALHRVLVEAYEILLADLLLPQLAGKVQDADFLAEAIEESRVLRRTAQRIELRQGAPERADAVQALHELLLVQAGEINDQLLPALQEVTLDYQQLAQDWAAHRVHLRELRAGDPGADQSSEDKA